MCCKPPPPAGLPSAPPLELGQKRPSRDFPILGQRYCHLMKCRPRIPRVLYIRYLRALRTCAHATKASGTSQIVTMVSAISYAARLKTFPDLVRKLPRCSPRIRRLVDRSADDDVVGTCSDCVGCFSSPGPAPRADYLHASHAL